MNEGQLSLKRTRALIGKGTLRDALTAILTAAWVQLTLAAPTTLFVCVNETRICLCSISIGWLSCGRVFSGTGHLGRPSVQGAGAVRRPDSAVLVIGI